MAGEMTRQDLENMEAKDRFWNALEYSYGKQVDQSNEDSRRAYSQASNQMLSRGMQRSSYGAQTLANLQTKGVEAANDILAQRNNAYAAQLYQIDRDAVADAQADRQFAAQYISSILAAGGTPSDELLARAGLSRDDYNAMGPQNTGGGGGWSGGYSYGGGGSGKTKTDTKASGIDDARFQSILDKIGNKGPTSSPTSTANIWAGLNTSNNKSSGSSSSSSKPLTKYEPSKMKSSVVKIND